MTQDSCHAHDQFKVPVTVFEIKVICYFQLNDLNFWEYNAHIHRRDVFGEVCPRLSGETEIWKFIILVKN